MPETPGGRYYAAPRKVSKPKPKPKSKSKLSAEAAKRRAELTAKAEARQRAAEAEARAAVAVEKEEKPRVTVSAPAPAAVIAPVVIGAPEPLGLGIVIPKPKPKTKPVPTERYIPTVAEVEHYEKVIKPKIEAAKKEEEEKVVAKAPPKEKAAPIVFGAPGPIGLGIVAPFVAPPPAPTPTVFGAPEPMGLGIVKPKPKVVVGAPEPGIIGPPHVAPTPPPRYAPIPETAAYVPPPTLEEVPLSKDEVQVKYDTLHTQADELAAEREEMLGPGGFGPGWSKKLGKLSPEEQREYSAKVKEEEYLRQQARILNDLILATKRKLPKGAKPYIEDILRDTGLPVTHTGEGTFYDIEKILGSKALTAQFLEEFPEQKGEIAAYKAQAVAQKEAADYILPDNKVDVVAALSGGVAPGSLEVLGVSKAAIAEARAYLVEKEKRETTLGKLESYFKAPVVFPGSPGFGLKGADVGGYFLPSAMVFGGVTAASLVGIFPKETIEAAKVEAARLRARPTEIMAAPEVAPSWWTSPLKDLVLPPGTVPEVTETPYAQLGGGLGWLGGIHKEGKAYKLPGAAEAFEAPTPEFLAIGFGVGPGAAMALAAAPLGVGPAAAYAGLGRGVGAGWPLIPRIGIQTALATVKLGGAVVTTTGVGALATGIGVPLPEIKVGLYESIDLDKLGTAAAHTKVASYGGDYGRMVEDLGPEKAAATLAQAGYKPEIPREAYERLSPEMQAVYTPSERRALAYEPGIAGVYGRGVEALYQPPVEWLREKGVAGQIGAGMFQYMVPHTLVTELYPTKGALALLALPPHFGPTLGYTGLTWEQQPWYGKAAGIGFAALPFAVGPVGSAAGWVGRGVSRVPVLGPTLKAVTGVIKAPFKVADVATFGLTKPILTTLERVAPWQAAYRVGRAVPGYGPWAASKGWLGATTPLSQTWRQWGGKPAVGFGETKIPWEIKQRVIREAQVAKMEAELAEPGITPLRAEVLRKALTPPAEWGYGPGGGSYVSMEPGVSVGHVLVLPRLPVSLSEVFKATIPTIARQVIPRVATAGAIAAPMLGGAFLPMMAPTMFATPTPGVDIPTLAKTDITTINQMLRENVITKAQHGQIVSQIHATQEIAVTPSQYHQQVQTVVQSQLTEQQIHQQQGIVQEQLQIELVKQQKILQRMKQQEVPVQQQSEQQQTVQQTVQQIHQQQEMVQQQLQQELVQQQTTLKQMEQQEVSQVVISEQQQVVQEVKQQVEQQQVVVQEQLQQELVQQQEILKQMEQQEVPVQQQMEQQQVVQQVEQQIVQQQEVVQQQQLQQEIVQQQIILEQMEQQEVSVAAIQGQQMVIQELQQQVIQQPTMFQQMFRTWPVTPPTLPPPPFPLTPFPFLPLFPGFPGIGAGFAGGFRAGRLRYGEKMWPFQELFISMPEPWTGIRKKKVIRKKGKLPYGGRIPRVKMVTRKGVRF